MARGDDRRDPLVIFRAPAAWKDRLYEHAAHQGVSVSVFCRTAIEAHLPAAPGNTAKAASAPPRRATRAVRDNAVMCEHRVPSGSYCRKCDARCNSGDRT